MSTNSDAEANHIHYDATQDKKIHKGMSPAKSRFPLCTFKTDTKSSLKFNERQCHSPTNRFKCTHCSCSFSAKGKLTAHKNAKHKTNGKVVQNMGKGSRAKWRKG